MWKCGYAKALSTIYTILIHFCFVCVLKNITATFPAATFSQMPTCHKGGQHFSQPLSQQRSVCLSASMLHMEPMPGMRWSKYCSEMPEACANHSTGGDVRGMSRSQSHSVAVIQSCSDSANQHMKHLIINWR